MDKQIVVYKTEDDLRLEVQTDGETVWLTQEQMCRLFGRTQSVIARHIANIFKEGELEKEVVYSKFAYTTRHGAINGKTQKLPAAKATKCCGLDARSISRSGSGGHFLNHRS